MSRLQHKRGRKSNYAKSMSGNEYWKEVRQSIIARDRECFLCGSKLYLEVHHKKYSVNGISIVGKEKEHLNCLVLLCSKCHQLEHIKK
jgi:5-methylcytosine-specific restriction endonuclease McrA